VTGEWEREGRGGEGVGEGGGGGKRQQNDDNNNNDNKNNNTLEVPTSLLYFH